MSEFDDIKGFDGWKSKLDALLAEARDAVSASDESRLPAIADRLTEFTIESWQRQRRDEALLLERQLQRCAARHQHLEVTASVEQVVHPCPQRPPHALPACEQAFERGRHEQRERERLGQYFDSHLAVELCIGSAPHFAHTALAELGGDAVMRDSLLGAHESCDESYHVRGAGKWRAGRSSL